MGGSKMKFVVQRNQLIESIQDVMKAISAKTAIPILSGIKIEVTDAGVKLTGSDSDITIESFIRKEEDGIVYVDNIEPGSIVVQAKYFPDIIRKLPDQTVSIETDENFTIKIRSGNAEFNLNGQDSDEYPRLPKLHTENSFELPADILKNMIKQTVFAVSTSETRPILTGVHMSIKDNLLKFVATDSHRLASKTVPLTTVITELNNKSVVIPGKSLNELIKILDDSQEKIEISVADNQILFQMKNVLFLSRLLDGNFPETSRLIPDQSKTNVITDTKILLESIDRASLLARESRNNVVKLITKGNNVLEISSNSPEVGKVEDEITVSSLDGEELKISFSAKYMMDALKAIDSEQVIIQFTGAMRPFVIRPTDENIDILQLILPVRTY
jgi:DNA polymerase III subunit beta